MKITLYTLLFFLFASCQNDDMSVEVYNSKKTKISEKPQSSMASQTDAMQKQSSKISWKTPKDWQEKSGNSIRIGSFSLPPVIGKKAELSIIVLAGQGGGIVPNINRWRGQLGLAEASAESINEKMGSLKGKLGKFVSIYIESTSMPKAIHAFFIEHKGKTIFIKVMGHPSVLKTHKAVILKFTKGIYEN